MCSTSGNQRGCCGAEMLRRAAGWGGPAGRKPCAPFEQRGAHDNHRKRLCAGKSQLCLYQWFSQHCCGFEFTKKCFFVVLQGSFPATRETWPLKWLTHIWTSASQWLFSRDCCSTLSRQRMLMYSGSWTVLKKKSGGCGDYKVLRANCNRGPLHYTDTWYRWQIRMN